MAGRKARSSVFAPFCMALLLAIREWIAALM